MPSNCPKESAPSFQPHGSVPESEAYVLCQELLTDPFQRAEKRFIRRFSSQAPTGHVGVEGLHVDELMQAVRRAPLHNTAHRAQVSQKWGDMMSVVGHVASHGLMSVRPQPSNPLMSRVTTLALWDRATEAIMRSTVAVGRPARLRAAKISA
jgi:hypothetical protein